MAFNGNRLPLNHLPVERCPQKLARLLESCWDADPERRPAAAEVVKDMTLVLQVRMQMKEGIHLQQQHAGRKWCMHTCHVCAAACVWHAPLGVDAYMLGTEMRERIKASARP